MGHNHPVEARSLFFVFFHFFIWVNSEVPVRLHACRSRTFNFVLEPVLVLDDKTITNCILNLFFVSMLFSGLTKYKSIQAKDIIVEMIKDT